MANDLTGLMKFAERPDWASDFQAVIFDHWNRACAANKIEMVELSSVLGPGYQGNLFAFAFEDFVSRTFPQGNIIDAYLRKKGFLESTGNKRYLKALRESHVTVYEASDIVPGVSCLVRDLVNGGEPIRITERTATRMMQPWAKFAARVIAHNDTHVFSGGIAVLEGALAEGAIDIMKRASGARWDHRVFALLSPQPATPAPTTSIAADIMTLWLTDALGRVMNPRLPELHNMSGHKMVNCKRTFPLPAGTSPTELRAAVRAMPGSQEDPSAGADTFVIMAAPKPGSKRKRALDPETVVIARLRLSVDKIVVETNSRERDRTVSRTIGKVLGVKVVTSTMKEETAGTMLAKGQLHPSSAATVSQIQQSSLDMIDSVHAQLDEQYLKTLDEPVPAIGNVSPRKAVKTERGRTKVVAWLKDLENYTAKQSGSRNLIAGYDCTWMWDELGIAHLRK